MPKKKENNIIEETEEQAKEIKEIVGQAMKRAKKITTNVLNGRFIHIRVGSSERPTVDEDIKQIDTEVKNLLKENNIDCIVLTTHEAVVIDLY